MYRSVLKNLADQFYNTWRLHLSVGIFSVLALATAIRFDYHVDRNPLALVVLLLLNYLMFTTSDLSKLKGYTDLVHIGKTRVISEGVLYRNICESVAFCLLLIGVLYLLFSGIIVTTLLHILFLVYDLISIIFLLVFQSIHKQSPNA